MQKLSIKETEKMEQMTGGFFAMKELVKLFMSCEIGESILVNHLDWTIKTNPTGAIVSTHLKKAGFNCSFKMRRLDSGKNYLFIRVK